MKVTASQSVCYYAFLISLVVSTSAVRAFVRPGLQKRVQYQRMLSLRGGTEEIPVVETAETPVGTKQGAVVPLVTASITAFGEFYGSSLVARPILTKSITAGSIFALSDYLAQRLENSKEKLNWTRMVSGGLVGLLYFGPAAHYWYEMIFRLLPGTTLVSTLQKAALGQLLFGPSFTCIFFGVSLLQAGNFSLGSWFRKIKQDLPGAWLAGAGFWPLVDLVSYSIIPMQWIPLFVNMCSLVWTIYLSAVANRSSGKNA